MPGFVITGLGDTFKVTVVVVTQLVTDVIVHSYIVVAVGLATVYVGSEEGAVPVAAPCTFQEYVFPPIGAFRTVETPLQAVCVVALVTLEHFASIYA